MKNTIDEGKSITIVRRLAKPDVPAERAYSIPGFSDMPNLESSKKALRKSLRNRERNIAARSKLKTIQKRFLAAIGAADKVLGAKAYADYCSVLDKAAKNGTIKKNNAIRHKTRAAAALRKLG